MQIFCLNKFSLSIFCINNTCPSNIRQVLTGLIGSHKMKPGETSSSSTPFSLTLIFSPGPTEVTSSSSDQS